MLSSKIILTSKLHRVNSSVSNSHQTFRFGGKENIKKIALQSISFYNGFCNLDQNQLDFSYTLDGSYTSFILSKRYYYDWSMLYDTLTAEGFTLTDLSATNQLVIAGISHSDEWTPQGQGWLLLGFSSSQIGIDSDVSLIPELNIQSLVDPIINVSLNFHQENDGLTDQILNSGKHELVQQSNLISSEVQMINLQHTDQINTVTIQLLHSNGMPLLSDDQQIDICLQFLVMHQ